MLYICICINYPTRFPYHLRVVSYTVTLRVPLVEQELLTLPRNHRVHTVFSGEDAPQFEVFCVVFGRLWYVFCPTSFGHSLNYGF